MDAVSRLIALLPLATLAACSQLQTRMGPAAAAAAADPWSWGPLAAGAVIGATGSDQRISHWARSQTPVFGSQDAAARASNQLRDLSSASAWGLFLFADDRGDGTWIENKTIDAGANLAGTGTALGISSWMKSAVGRRRPGGRARTSFPSNHATGAFADASIARYYADDLPVSNWAREGATTGVDLMATATAWSRIESGNHYPTDVLAGAAIGNFSVRFFNELLAPDTHTGWHAGVQRGADGTVFVTASVRF